ncbi:membrane-associated tyrosine- and threonine-specific cdc2-inhibitory kinase-like [Ptychodera flava]|uniref:membrane-associated tyrosine- and threonine-specific cdc2-inhibitory kinase-like n=1 Tax=Ptychodera flava TaxID=63121 RepID=UPI00396A7F9B
MNGFKSPRPTPQFFHEPAPFSHKKDLDTPRDTIPPRPPVKSAPPISRLFPHVVKEQQRAQAVSFRSSESSYMNSPHYDEGRKDLYFDQCFAIESKLGVGSFGEVFKVYSKEDGKFYAIKRSRDRFRGESDRKRKLEEVRKHEDLPKHANCVQFYKAWEEKGHLYIQTELCDQSLQQFAETNHDIPEKTIWNILIDLLEGVKHLHDHNLIHMDIKPANVFISIDGVYKLGDFGLVLDIEMGDLSEAQEGDPKYLAPELLRGKFGKPADVFSLGISVLELACDLELPKGGDPWHQLRNGNIPSQFTHDLSDDLCNVIYTMMEPDHNHRLSLDQVLAMPVVKRQRRRRRRELRLHKMWSKLLAVYHLLYTLLHTAWLTMAYPVKMVRKKRRGKSELPDITPRSQRRHPSEWDNSFSDDDCFSDEVSLTNNSIGIPIMNSSTSSEDDSMKFRMTNPSPRITCVSTPLSTDHKYSPIPRSSSPVSTFISSKIGRYTPQNSPSISFVSTNSYTPSSSSRNNSLLDSDDISFKPGIEPKNLMEVFEEAALSDSE